MRGDAATSPRPLYGILLAWGGAALSTGAVEALLRTLVPVPLILASLVAAGLLAWRLSAKVRGWVRAVPPRALVALHLVRFVGAWFIVLYRRGELWRLLVNHVHHGGPLHLLRARHDHRPNAVGDLVSIDDTCGLAQVLDAPVGA